MKDYKMRFYFLVGRVEENMFLLLNIFILGCNKGIASRKPGSFFWILRDLCHEKIQSSTMCNTKFSEDKSCSCSQWYVKKVMRRIECQCTFFVRSSLLIYILFKFYVFLIVLFNSRGFVAVTLLQNHFSSFLLSEILVLLSSFLLRDFFWSIAGCHYCMVWSWFSLWQSLCCNPFGSCFALCFSFVPMPSTIQG